MGRNRRVVATAALAIGMLPGLAACGGGDSSDDPGQAVSLPHDTSSSARASDDATDAPAPAIEQENPARFVERWAAIEATMQHTGKTGPYLALSRGCPACRRIAHTVSDYYAAGGFVRGGDWKIDSVRISPSSQAFVVYVVRAHAAAMTVRESASQPVQHVPGGPVTYLVGLMAKDSSFTVVSRTRAS